MVCLLPYIPWLCQNLWFAGSSLPSERSYAECWVRGGHWCKEWHLNKKHSRGRVTFSLHISNQRIVQISSGTTPPAPSYSQLTDGNSCEEAGWVPGRRECQHLQQMSLSPSRAVLPQVQQRSYTSGNNSHVLGDPAVRITVNWLWESHNCMLGSAQTPSEWNKSH